MTSEGLYPRLLFGLRKVLINTLGWTQGLK